MTESRIFSESLSQWLLKAKDLGGRSVTDVKPVFVRFQDGEYVEVTDAASLSKGLRRRNDPSVILSQSFCLWLREARDINGWRFEDACIACIDDMMEAMDGAILDIALREKYRESVRVLGLGPVLEAFITFKKIGLASHISSQDDDLVLESEEVLLGRFTVLIPQAYEIMISREAVDGYHRDFVEAIAAFSKQPELFTQDGQRTINAVVRLINKCSGKDPMPLPFEVPDVPGGPKPGTAPAEPSGVD